MARSYYVSNSGTVHLAEPNPQPSQYASTEIVLVCSMGKYPQSVQRRYNNRWFGTPPMLALEEQWTIEQLDGKTHKWQGRKPLYICRHCFPGNPDIVGVV